MSAITLSSMPSVQMKLCTLREVITRSADPGAASGPDTGPKPAYLIGPNLAASAYLASKSARPLRAPAESLGLSRSATPAM